MTTAQLQYIRNELGEDTLSPAFVKHLEHYYDRAPTADKAKCLELITSIKLGEEVRNSRFRRPKTAMPSLGGNVDFPEDVLSPYKTTYKREYLPRGDADIRAIRPQTSQGYTNPYDLSGHIGNTTYNEEYGHKIEERRDPERSGSASGARNNNPHPSKGFMVWRFPSRRHPVYNKPPKMTPAFEHITNEKINQLNKRLLSSTYQNDFIGIPQGFQVKSAYDLPPDWRDNVPYTLDSIQRYSYQGVGVPQTELRLPTTRYGSNRKKHVPANGAIPTASNCLNSVKKRTTYDSFYNENTGQVRRQVRDIGHRLGMETLKKYYDRAMGEEREMLGRLLDAYQNNSTHRQSRTCARPVVPACTSVTNFCTSPVPRPPPGSPTSGSPVQEISS